MRTSERPVPSRSRRGWRWGGIGALGFALVTAAWLVSHLIPRDRWFVERRGTLARVEARSPQRSRDDILSQAVRLEAANGLAVNLRILRRPAIGRRLPVVVLLGGLGTGRDAVDVVGDPGRIAVAALDYPYQGPQRTHGVIELLGAIPQAQAGLLDTPPALSLVVDWLQTLDWVDPGRIELMGVSLGVPFAAVAGALDPRFRRVWLAHGGVGNRAWIAQRPEARITNGPLRHATAALVHLLAYGPSFNTERWVPAIAPRAIVIIGATADEEMPRARVEQLYDAARPPRELLWTGGGHIRPDRTEIVHQLISLVQARIETPEPVAAR